MGFAAVIVELEATFPERCEIERYSADHHELEHEPQDVDHEFVRVPVFARGIVSINEGFGLVVSVQQHAAKFEIHSHHYCHVTHSSEKNVYHRNFLDVSLT